MQIAAGSQDRSRDHRQSLPTYSYASDDPLNAVDPTGDCPSSVSNSSGEPYTLDEAELIAENPSGSDAASAALGLVGLGAGIVGTVISLGGDLPIAGAAVGLGGLGADVASGSLGGLWSSGTQVGVSADLAGNGANATGLVGKAVGATSVAADAAFVGGAAGAVGVAASLSDAGCNIDTVWNYWVSSAITRAYQEKSQADAEEGNPPIPFDPELNLENLQ